MSAELLRCGICPPRQAEFSDISHLLTHVSSKAHLANLHKLQVRSHQEISAGVVLAEHNQWYQQHGLAQLLSERMLMKDAKKAAKCAPDGIIKRGEGPVKTESFVEPNPDESSPIRQVTRNRARNQAKRAKRLQVVEEEDSDLPYSPIQGQRRSKRLSHLITPVKRTPLPSSPPPYNGLRGVEPALATPGPNAKLKGKIWPGMDLFDAATPDEARRRNQRKDGSVVKKMERLSRLVEPKESVYSMSGTLKVQRHLDELDDNINLIEGETPIPKSKPRIKRKVLGHVSANAPRLVKRKSVKARSPRKMRQQSGLPQSLPIRSPSTRLGQNLQSQYTPSEEENMEFRLAVKEMSLRKRPVNFTVFNDSSTAYLPRMASFPSQHMSLNQNYNLHMSQRLGFVNHAWLQPQNQNPLYVENNLRYGTAYSNYMGYQAEMSDKENVMPDASSINHHATNPLAWTSAVPDLSAGTESSDSTFGSLSGYFGNMASSADPFGPVKNPLAGAFSPTKNPLAEAFARFGDAIQGKDFAGDAKMAEKPVYEGSSQKYPEQTTCVATGA